MSSWLPPIALLLALASASPAQLADLIPPPREVQPGGEPITIDDARLVVPSGMARARLAAGEINDRLQRLGHAAWPVDVVAEVAFPAGPVIMIATAETPGVGDLARQFGLSVTPISPGPEGYSLTVRRAGDHWQALLLGCDEIGMLYAAVTFRAMLDSTPAGELRLAPATVRDWPAFRWRKIGDPFAEHRRSTFYALRDRLNKGDEAAAKPLIETYLTGQQRYIDYLLRHKINMMDDSANWSGREVGSVQSNLRQMMRTINDYALARGVRAFLGDTTAIGTYPKDQDNPEFNACVHNRSDHRYFCWSALELHRAEARKIGAYLRDTNTRGYYLHATDSGGWENPALWDDRCERCRQMYGDDHARADATVFGIYHDAIQAVVPDVSFAAVVYPYTPSYLDPAGLEGRLRELMGNAPGIRAMAEEKASGIRDFLERVNALLPPDISVVIRENARANEDRMREVYGPRPFYLYYEYAYWKGWRPEYVTYPRWSRTFLYPGYDDILFGNILGTGFNEPTELLAAQFAWNPSLPGAGDFDYAAWLDPGQCQQPAELREPFLTRACADLYGPVVGPYLVPYYLANISREAIVNTDDVASQLGLEPLAALETQHQALLAVLPKLDAMWARIQGDDTVRRSVDPYFLANLAPLTQMASGARVLSGHKTRLLRARRLITAGDLAAAEQAVGEARAFLAEQGEAHRARVARLRPESYSVTPSRSPRAPGVLFHVDPEALAQEWDKLWAERESLYAAYNLPDWLRKEARDRQVSAVRTAVPPTIDGRLDEPVWQSATLVERFLDYDRLRLAGQPTTARLLFDDQRLYLGFACVQPDAAVLAMPSRPRDDHKPVESIEVLLDPGRTKQSFDHFIIDAGGTLFDAAQQVGQDGRARYDLDWNGPIQYQVARTADGWSAELAIEFAGLGAKPSGGWGVLLCRNVMGTRPAGALESTSIVDLQGGNFHSVEHFASLRFQAQPDVAPLPAPTLTVASPVVTQETTGEGNATVVRFGLTLETRRTLHEVTVTARATGTDGKVRLESELWREPHVEVLKRSAVPLALSIPGQLDGVRVDLTLTCTEGTWKQAFVAGDYRRSATGAKLDFAPGHTGQAAAGPFLVPVVWRTADGEQRLINSAAGTIACWFQPRWDSTPQVASKSRMRHALFDAGPVRYDHPLLTNLRSVALYETDSGGLVFQVTNHRYESRAVSTARLAWQAGQWHHVLAQWQQDPAGKFRMALYLDGKLAAGTVRAGRDQTADDPFDLRDEAFAIQFGSMNTGAAPADGLIDELHISPRWSHDGPFSPAGPVPAGDALALPLDGSLEPAGPGPKAVAGTVG